MKITFNQHNEFIEELKRDSQFIDRKIVRVTRQFRRAGGGLPFTEASILASYSIRVNPQSGNDHSRQVISLNNYCGRYMLEDPHEEKVLKLADEIQGEIEAAAKKLNMEIRAGFIENGGE